MDDDYDAAEVWERLIRMVIAGKESWANNTRGRSAGGTVDKSGKSE